jgi:hypothetical protein
VMAKVGRLVVLLGLAALLPGAPADASPASPLCWKEPRVYSVTGKDARAVLAALDRSLRIDRVPQPLPRPFVLNPDDAYAYHLTETAIPGAWSGATHSELLVFTEEPTLLRVSLNPTRGVGSVRWVSEKLLYARVWIGRQDAVDIILDVETATILDRQPLRDGGALQQQARESCRVLRDHPDCRPACPTVGGPAPDSSSPQSPAGRSTGH